MQSYRMNHFSSNNLHYKRQWSRKIIYHKFFLVYQFF